MTDELQKLMTAHMALVLELAPLAQKVADVLVLVEAMGHQINAALASSSATLAPVEQWPQIGETGAADNLTSANAKPCTNPTKRTFTRDYLMDELDLPGGKNQIHSEMSDRTRWSICYEIVFRTPELPAGYGWFTGYSVGATESQDETPWQYEDEVECTLVRLSRKTVPDWVPATMPEPSAPTLDQLGGFGFDRGPEPVIPEMAVHVPRTVPPPVETNEIGAIVHSAGFAPDASMLRDDNIIDPARGANVFGEKPKRAKTEYTAREWADSMHFLHFMKKPPFKDWPAEQQNAKRDEFVSSVPADERMNRWGQRFAKFCGVST